jgi:ribosome maturation factor RimP
MAKHPNILPLTSSGRCLRLADVYLAYRGCLDPIQTTQDEELVVTERPRGLPSPPEVIELLSGDFERAGYQVDDVRIQTDTRPPRITVIADGDVPLDLDTIAELSRAASERLDAIETDAESYVLEVSSPGVDRPLTAERHYRRARGRKVELRLTDGAGLTGRIGATTDGVLHLVTRANPRSPWSVRRIALTDIAEAVVQVEFSAPSARELELVARDEEENNGTEARA